MFVTVVSFTESKCRYKIHDPHPLFNHLGMAPGVANQMPVTFATPATSLALPLELYI